MVLALNSLHAVLSSCPSTAVKTACIWESSDSYGGKLCSCRFVWSRECNSPVATHLACTELQSSAKPLMPPSPPQPLSWSSVGPGLCVTRTYWRFEDWDVSNLDSCMQKVGENSAPTRGVCDANIVLYPRLDWAVGLDWGCMCCHAQSSGPSYVDAPDSNWRVFQIHPMQGLLPVPPMAPGWPQLPAACLAPPPLTPAAPPALPSTPPNPLTWSSLGKKECIESEWWRSLAWDTNSLAACVQHVRANAVELGLDGASALQGTV